MFNAEGIIELEKKWLEYKLKQKSKLFIFIIFTLIALLFASYQIYLNIYTKSSAKKDKIPKKTLIVKTKPLISKPILKEDSNTKNKISVQKNDKLNNITEVKIKKIPNKVYIENNIKIAHEANTTKNIKTIPSKLVINKVNSKPYFLSLEPTDQGSELFTSNGFLTLNVPLQIRKNLPSNIEQPSLKTLRNITETTTISKERLPNKILIDSKEVDTIRYLKEKYYATSSIVFALMLAEEYYYEKDYKNSLQWALTANDDDSQNIKSWSWFAKAKVKLGQKEDAIKALKAYLSNNNSKRLSTLLRKIEFGDTNDK